MVCLIKAKNKIDTRILSKCFHCTGFYNWFRRYSASWSFKKAFSSSFVYKCSRINKS